MRRSGPLRSAVRWVDEAPSEERLENHMLGIMNLQRRKLPIFYEQVVFASRPISNDVAR